MLLFRLTTNGIIIKLCLEQSSGKKEKYQQMFFRPVPAKDNTLPLDFLSNLSFTYPIAAFT